MEEGVTVIGNVEYAGHTTVNPLGVFAVVVLGLCVLFLPRQWTIVPFLVMACFVSSAQRIVIAGFDFNFLRIMVLFGVLRVIMRREFREFNWQLLDVMVVLWVLSSMFFFVFRVGTFPAVVSRLGFGFDVLGMYFLFRCQIRDLQDIDCIVMGGIAISILIAAFFLFENQTGRNLFAIFGGVCEITWVRDGRLRCQGAFSHAILAGCFWAVLMPLMAAYWWKSATARFFAVAGLVSALIVVYCCASSTPVMGVLAGILGGLLFPLRRFMRSIRWGLLLIFIALHFMMNAPVWHLIGRIGAVGGSTGYHRYMVIEQTVKHFDQWWLSGCSVFDILEWGIFAGDITNHYIAEGVTSGFLTMCLFITIIVVAFRDVGRLCQVRKQNRYRLVLSWALGVALFVHSINFIGVAYFGQIQMLWYLTLAMIGSASAFEIRKLRATINRQPHTRFSQAKAMATK
jgi:hypothetical protein